MRKGPEALVLTDPTGHQGRLPSVPGPGIRPWDSRLWNHFALVYGYLFHEHCRGLFQANYSSGLRPQVIDSAINIMEEDKAKRRSEEWKARYTFFLAKRVLSELASPR